MPVINRKLTSRLASHVGISHLHTLDTLDLLADDVGEEINRIIGRVVFAVNNGSTATATALLNELPIAVARKLKDNMEKAAKYQGKAVALSLVKSLPVEYLPVELLAQEAIGFKGLQATFTQKLFPRLKAISLTKNQLKDRFRELLIEPLKKSTLEKIILGGASAVQNIIQQVKLSFNPNRVVQVLSRSIADGENRVEQARRLRDELAITRSAAKRIARTEGTRVATETNMASYDELGDAVIGFQLHSVLDERTRTWHRKRNGTIYYKNPKQGQKGFYQMPHPPREPDDPNERPAGTPDTAFNCRCFLSPVFAPADDLPELPRDAEKKIIPDQIVYQDWWNQAPERLKRKAVGSRRYDLVTSLHGENASYFHYVDDNGELLSLDDLSIERVEDTAARVMVNRMQSQQNKVQRKSVLTYGQY